MPKSLPDQFPILPRPHVRATIESARLRHGEREGDVIAAYSADLICEKNSRIRKPFRWRDALWCCVGICGSGAGTEAHAYRLTSLASFTGIVTSYSEKLSGDQGEGARNDPDGFYHGMRVSSGGAGYVLTGPELKLTAGGEPEQGNLFG